MFVPSSTLAAAWTRCVVVLLLITIPLAVTGTAADTKAASTTRAMTAQFGHMPLAFEPNRGQVDGRVKFLSRSLGASIFFSPEKVVIGSEANRSVSLSFPGSKGLPRIESLDELPGKVNYLQGRDSSKWITGVPTFATVKYVGVYPGIDVRFHGKGSQLEYDFDVAPGADPREIKIKFDRSARIHLDASGNLIIEQGGVEIRQHPPHAYQNLHGIQREIASHAVVSEKNEVSFALAEYDHKAKLVIDPVLVYSTYLGGSGGGNIGFSDYPAAVATDAAGNTYLAGSAPSPDFPVTAGAFRTKKPDYPNYPAAFVAKLNPDGSALIYSTFLGGSNTDTAVGIAVDVSGNAYVTGITASTDFPVVKPFQAKNNDKNQCIAGVLLGFSPCSAFVAELNATGSALLYSSYLGGTGADSASGIALDPQNNAYISGTTTSTDFPVTASAAQPTYGGGKSDGFVAKISASGSAAYATYLGGSFDDAGVGIAADGSGNAYVTGNTASSDFRTTAGVVQPNLAVGSCGSNPCHDAYVTKLNSSGSIVYSTFLGGTGEDEVAAIGMDASGDAYLTGQTASTDFPLQSPFETYPGGTTNAFVAKLSSDATALVFSTYFGNSASGDTLTVDNGGNVFFAGSHSSSVPLVSPLQSSFSGTGMFLSEFNPAGQNLLFSTYFAGDAAEIPNGIAIDSAGNLFLVGETGSSDFPVYRALRDICPLGGDGRYCPDISEATPGTGFVAKFNTGSGKALVFVPHSTRVFGNTPAGGSTPGPSVLLLSMGTDPVQINSIASSTPDFTPDTTCVGSLAGGQQCQIAITFTPQQSFTRTATLTVTDDDVTSPQQVPLTGFGTGNGVVSLSLANDSIAFGFQPIGTTKSQQFAITNIGTDVLTFAGISITQGINDGFSQTNDCPVQPSTMAVGGICTVTVGFTPTKPGGMSDTLFINTDDAHTPTGVRLTGTGTGSGLGLGVPAGGTSSDTVTAGSTANYTLAIGGAGSSGTATLSCTGAPTGARCSLPANVPVNANTASTFDVSVTTTARANAMLVPSRRSLGWFWATTLLGIVFLSAWSRRRLSLRGLSWLPMLLILFLIACGGGGGGSGGSSGTPANTYTLTVKATMGNTTQSTNLKLIVK